MWWWVRSASEQNRTIARDKDMYFIDHSLSRMLYDTACSSDERRVPKHDFNGETDVNRDSCFMARLLSRPSFLARAFLLVAPIRVLCLLTKLEYDPHSTWNRQEQGSCTRWALSKAWSHTLLPTDCGTSGWQVAERLHYLYSMGPLSTIVLSALLMWQFKM